MYCHQYFIKGSPNYREIHKNIPKWLKCKFVNMLFDYPPGRNVFNASVMQVSTENIDPQLLH
jgi:hypothetical protein